MLQSLSFFQPSNLGNNVGPGSDGVLCGVMTPVAPAKFLLSKQAAAGLCITDFAGLYTNETQAFGDATTDDVELTQATPADDDALYVGHASGKFGRVDLNITTTGVGTWTLDFEYWNGEAFVPLEDVVDGTGGFVGEGTGWKSITFTVPTDWAKCTVDGVLAYWIRAVVDDYSAITTAPQAGQGYVVLTVPTWVDDTTDFGDADTGDVDLLPAYPIVGDAVYIGHTEPFPLVKVTTSTARTGTAELTWKYWTGTAWAAVPVLADDTAGWSTSAGALLVHLQPPANWAACTQENGPNGQAGYFLKCELTAMTDVTAQPKATRGYVCPVTTGATGISCPVTGSVTKISMMAQTKSASNADSKFLLINATKGTWVAFTWTKATALVEATVSLAVTLNDDLLLMQITEDGSTEFANANFLVAINVA